MVLGSIALQYRANRRTIARRLAHWAGWALAGCMAQANAIGSDVGGSGRIGEGDESLEQTAGKTQLVAEGTASRQILVESFLKRAHDRPPGQGNAMARSAAMSTLA